MKIGLIKWFYQGDSIRNKCLGALESTDLSKLNKDQIEEKTTEVYNALHLSKAFEDSKRSAIRSTLKQIIRERKALGIAFHLDIINGIPIQTDKAEQFLKYLTNEEKKIISERPTTWTIRLNQYIRYDKPKRYDKPNGEIINVSEVAKKMMKEIEATLEALNAKKLKQDLFAELNEDDKDLILQATKANEPGTLCPKLYLEKLSFKRNEDSKNENCSSTTSQFLSLQADAITKLANNPAMNDPRATCKKVWELQKIAKKNRSILRCFSKTEIHLMNLLFNANLPTEKEKKFSPYYGQAIG